MRKLTIMLIFLCAQVLPEKTFGQNQGKNFLTADLQVDIPKNTYGVGARLSGGINVNQLLLVGLGLGFSRIDDLGTSVIPVFAHFSIGNFSKKTFPYFIAEPGYGIYKNTITTGSTEVT